MISKRFKPTPCYGFIPRDNTMFRDADLFGTEMWKYQVLKKVILWYGSVKSGDDNLKNKAVLGIQCVYVDTITGNTTTTEQHCGDVLKLLTHSGQSIEVGMENDETKKTIDINLEKTPQMVHTFFGYYNPYGLRALGFKYISKKDFILINLMGIFRLKHLFNINEAEKEKWKNEEELNKLDEKMKAITKLCLLPEQTFFCVLKFCRL